MPRVQVSRCHTAFKPMLWTISLLAVSLPWAPALSQEAVPNYVTFAEAPDPTTLAEALGLRDLAYAVVSPGGDRLDRPAAQAPKKRRAAAKPARSKTPKVNRAAAKPNIKDGLIPESWVTEIVAFENGSGRIYSTEMGILDTLGALMQNDEAFVLVVSGHANATGSHETNDRLAMERSMAVAAYISRVYRIGPERFDLRWMGARDPLPGTHPAAPENRRVQFGVLPLT